MCTSCHDILLQNTNKIDTNIRENGGHGVFGNVVNGEIFVHQCDCCLWKMPIITLGHGKGRVERSLKLLLCRSCTIDLFLFQIERNKLLKEQQAKEEALKQKDELEKRLQETEEEAKRSKDALVRTNLLEIDEVSLECFNMKHLMFKTVT